MTADLPDEPELVVPAGDLREPVQRNPQCALAYLVEVIKPNGIV